MKKNQQLKPRSHFFFRLLLSVATYCIWSWISSNFLPKIPKEHTNRKPNSLKQARSIFGLVIIRSVYDNYEYIDEMVIPNVNHHVLQQSTDRPTDWRTECLFLDDTLDLSLKRSHTIHSPCYYAFNFWYFPSSSSKSKLISSSLSRPAHSPSFFYNSFFRNVIAILYGLGV